MKHIIILFFILTTCSVSSADDLLDVLSSEKKSELIVKDSENLSQLKILVANRGAEQNIFFNFIEEKNFRKALYQWMSAFENSKFSQTDNGKALYAYLLMKNNLEVAGLTKLFETRPSRVSKKVLNLWQDEMRGKDYVWPLSSLTWAKGWTEIFGIAAEVSVKARYMNITHDVETVENLLKKTVSGSWERNWLSWRYFHLLVGRGDDIKAARLLRYLQESRVNNPVSEDLINLTAGRILYQNGHLGSAIKHYKKVPKGNDYWFESLEEIAWSEMRLGKPQDALARIKTLVHPALKSEIGPDVFYLQSLAHLKMCDYKEVSKDLKEFRGRFSKKYKTLYRLTQKLENKDQMKLFKALSNHSVSNLNLGSSADNLPRHIVKDELLKILLQRKIKLDAEALAASSLYSQSLTEGTSQVGFQGSLEKLKNELSVQARGAHSTALLRLKNLALEEIKEITNVLNKMQIVDAELIQQLAMSERVIKDSKKETKATYKKSTQKTDLNKLEFPALSEVWFDELDTYKIKVTKGCQAKTKGSVL